MWGAVAGAVAPAVIGSLLGGGGKVKQQPLETPEQAAARRKLMGFANTGKFGNFEAGAEVPLGYGDFGPTDIEGQGLSSLQGLLKSGIPDQFRMGDEALRDLLATSPQQIETQFQPIRDQVTRSIRDSNTTLKRNAGFAGNLYSTDTIRNLGDIEARGNETLTSSLAGLIDSNLNRRLQAIPLAYQSGEAQQNAILQQVGASQQYGGLTRQLNDASIKARDSELLRRRQELQLPIQAAQTVAGGPPQFGVPEVSQASPFQGVLDLASQIGGQYLGNEMTMRQYQRYFPAGVR